MPKYNRTRDLDQVRALRDRFADDVRAGRLGIAEAVRRMREISGLTQAEFAAHRGVSLKTLKNIELGKANPTVSTLDAIGAVFGLHMGFVPNRSPSGEEGR